MKDIMIAIGYAFFPMIVGLNLGTLVSQIVAENEEAFYGIILGLGVAYGVIMMMIGIMQVHNYSLGKTLGTLFLSVVAVFIIIFLGLLLVDLVTRLFTFFKSVYTELSFRT